MQSDQLAQALVRAQEHWERRSKARGAGASTTAFTIALSREAGARGTSVAQALGRRLGWPVYDRELLTLIAHEMGLRENLLQTVDEKHVPWFREAVEAFASVPVVSVSDFARRLVETVLSLGAHGHCIIVGRGTAFLLRPETTLRVRLVAPLPARVAVMQQEHKLSHEEAERRVKKVDQERTRFVREYFLKDANDPAAYDLLVNTARYSVEEAAEIIIESLRRAEAHVSQKRPSLSV